MAFSLALMALSMSSIASHCELSAGGQGRWYPDETQLPRDHELVGSLTGEMACSHSFGPQAVAAKVFGRLSQYDSARTHADIRELYWSWTEEEWQVRAGVDRVFWGVTEFAHIVDIVNQADLLEDPFGDIKMGLPMIVGTSRREWGALSVFVLPQFRDRIYPDLGEPMRPAPPVNLGEAEFESPLQRGHVDAAVRYSHTHGPLDFGLTYFSGTSRDPRFRFELDDLGISVGHAVYDQITQAGLDLQLTLDEWVLKLEGAQRKSPLHSRSAYTVGTEYAFVGVNKTQTDITAVAEYVRDRRDPLPNPGFLNDEFAFGMRLSGNDPRTREGKIGVTFDRRLSSMAWAFEFSMRFGRQWRLNSQARFFRNVSPKDPLYVLQGDSYFDLSFTHYFLSPPQ